MAVAQQDPIDAFLDQELAGQDQSSAVDPIDAFLDQEVKTQGDGVTGRKLAAQAATSAFGSYWNLPYKLARTGQSIEQGLVGDRLNEWRKGVGLPDFYENIDAFGKGLEGIGKAREANVVPDSGFFGDLAQTVASGGGSLFGMGGSFPPAVRLAGAGASALSGAVETGLGRLATRAIPNALAFGGVAAAHAPSGQEVPSMASGGAFGGLVGGLGNMSSRLLRGGILGSSMGLESALGGGSAGENGGSAILGAGMEFLPKGRMSLTERGLAEIGITPTEPIEPPLALPERPRLALPAPNAGLLAAAETGRGFVGMPEGLRAAWAGEMAPIAEALPQGEFPRRRIPSLSEAVPRPEPLPAQRMPVELPREPQLYRPPEAGRGITEAELESVMRMGPKATEPGLFGPYGWEQGPVAPEELFGRQQRQPLTLPEKPALRPWEREFLDSLKEGGESNAKETRTGLEARGPVQAPQMEQGPEGRLRLRDNAENRMEAQPQEQVAAAEGGAPTAASAEAALELQQAKPLLIYPRFDGDVILRDTRKNTIGIFNSVEEAEKWANKRGYQTQKTDPALAKPEAAPAGEPKPALSGPQAGPMSPMEQAVNKGRSVSDKIKKASKRLASEETGALNLGSVKDIADETVQIVKRAAIRTGVKTAVLQDQISRPVRAFVRAEAVLRDNPVGLQKLNERQDMFTRQNLMAAHWVVDLEKNVGQLSLSQKRFLASDKFFDPYERGGVEAVAEEAQKAGYGGKALARIRSAAEAYSRFDNEGGDIATNLGVMVKDRSRPSGFNVKAVVEILNEGIPKGEQKFKREDILTEGGRLSIRAVQEILGQEPGTIKSKEDLAEMLGVPVEDIWGSYRRFEKIPNHIPHQMTDEFRRAIIAGPGDRVFDAIVNAAGKRGVSGDDLQKLLDFGGTRKYGPLEYVRESELPAILDTEIGKIKVWRTNVLELWAEGIERMSERLAVIESVGQFGASKKIKADIAEIRAAATKGDGGRMAEAYQEIWNQVNREQRDNLANLLEVMHGPESYARTAQLSSAAISQLSGLGPVMTNHGAIRTAKALVTVLGDTIARRGQSLGLNLFPQSKAEMDVLRNLGGWTIDTIGHTSTAEDLNAIGTNSILRATQFNRANRIINKATTIAAVHDFGDAINFLRADQMVAPRSKVMQTLRRVWQKDAFSTRDWLKKLYNWPDAEISRMVESGIDYKDFVAVAEKAATDPEFNRAILDIARVAQTGPAKANIFRETPLTRPPIFSQKGTRLVFAYMSYLRAQGARLTDAMQTARRTGNLRPLFTKLVGDLAGGTIVSTLKDQLFDREHDADTPLWVKLLDYWTEAATFGVAGGFAEDVYWKLKTDRPSTISIAQWEWLGQALLNAPYKAAKEIYETGQIGEGLSTYYKEVGKKTPLVRAIDAQLEGPIWRQKQPPRRHNTLD